MDLFLFFLDALVCMPRLGDTDDVGAGDAGSLVGATGGGVSAMTTLCSSRVVVEMGCGMPGGGGMLVWLLGSIVCGEVVDDGTSPKV